MYKTLGFKWLLECFCPHQLLHRQTVTKPAIPNVSYMYPLSAYISNIKLKINKFYAIITNIFLILCVNSC